MRTETHTNPLVAFLFTVLLVMAVLIGSAATAHPVSGDGLTASARTDAAIPGRS